MINLNNTLKTIKKWFIIANPSINIGEYIVAFWILVPDECYFKVCVMLCLRRKCRT